jgi:hypothetical protein
MHSERSVEAVWTLEKGINMRKIDEVRNIDGAPAVFLRYARSEYVVIAVEGAEREMTRSAWLNLPIWQFVVPSQPRNTTTNSGK